MNKEIWLLPLILTFLPFSLMAQNEHDGFWWTSQSSTAKVFFVSGYVEGMSAASAGVKAAVSEGAAKDSVPSRSFLLREFDYSNVRAGQLVDGVDEFYKDFRNKGIEIADALLYVRDQISGESEERLKDFLNKLRQAQKR